SEHREVEEGGVVDERIAHVHADRVVAVLLADGEQPRRDLLIGLFPGDLLPSGCRPPHGTAQSIGVVVELLDAVRLRADVAARERVLFVSANRDDRWAVDVDGETAGGLAEWTDTGNGAHGRVSSALRDSSAP